MAPLNDNEIVVMGGCDKSGFLGDVIVFNTQTQQCQNVVQDSAFKFEACSNQCAKTNLNTVVALVHKDGKSSLPTLIKWTKGESAFTISRTFYSKDSDPSEDKSLAWLPKTASSQTTTFSAPS